ncbi:ceramidase domain-containing protein [Cyclobacterium xiamenense]|uniref:ceramidase domain-containing protein n=1 Tax=Cyclobacterium xiamenense TaxID=1297121 RepID=UPI0012B8883A|nr:ceramidase domain-containing protein [Cyclobacterium xiamenense]
MSQEQVSVEKRLHVGMAERLKLNRLPLWVHGIGLGGTGLVFLLAVLAFAAFKDVPVWVDWVPASEFTAPKYAERIYPDSIFRTRMNTWSNLVYICFGFYAVALAIYDWKRKLPLQRGYLTFAPVQTFLFGLAGIYLGLGSGFFHASLTRYGQQCDVGGMYATMICLAAFAIGSWLPRMRVPRTRRPMPSWPVLAVMVVYGSAYFSYYKWDYSFSEISGYLTGILVLFAGVSLIQPGRYVQFRWFVAAVVAITLGSRIRDLDIAGKFSGPDAIFQGHALWHLVSCLFYVFLFAYFRSEEREDK